MAWAWSSSSQEFRLVSTTVRIPERGDVPSLLLLTESNRFAFIPPPEWKVSTTISERKLTMEARDFKGAITVRIIAGPTNLVDVKTLRDQLADRFAGSKITKEGECYTSGGRGPVFDLDWTINGNEVSMRIGFIPFSGGMVEFSVTSLPGNFAGCRLPFGNLLTSFSVEPRLPKGSGG